jgi:hypothetical protein
LAGPFDDSNTNGIYHKKFKIDCPYEGRRRKVHFFYLHKNGSDISTSPSCAYYNQNHNAQSTKTITPIKPVCRNSSVSVKPTGGEREGGVKGGEHVGGGEN